MCDETWHGWTNRETWAFHLWITNEEATASEARLIAENAAASAREENRGTSGLRAAANALRVWWDDTLDAARENGYTETLTAMRDDVGSVWRIDWDVIAEAMLPARTLSDEVALDHIARMLQDPDWGVGMLEDVAAWVMNTGRSIQGTCGSCGHLVFPTGDPCEADGCSCPQHEPRPTWDRH